MREIVSIFHTINYSVFHVLCSYPVVHLIKLIIREREGRREGERERAGERKREKRGRERGSRTERESQTEREK